MAEKVRQKTIRSLYPVDLTELRAADAAGVQLDQDLTRCERCRQFDYDLARGRVPISPTAHFVMGGAVIDVNCKASFEKLFVSGEDAGGVHGANRLGGNGICESCVYGRQAGKALAKYLSNGNRAIQKTRRGQAEEAMDRLSQPMTRTNGPSQNRRRYPLRTALSRTAWKR